MSYTRVKICGIKSWQDAILAIKFGADALGFVFYPTSPRYISINDASLIIRKLPPFISTVGLLVNPTEDFVREVISKVPINLLQFHGNESAKFCEQFKFPFIKAIAMQDDIDLNLLIGEYNNAKAILVDSFQKDKFGGTGKTFNWQLITNYKQLDKQLILAGGLNPDNVATAITAVKPFAVDVSSGVENSIGIKCQNKIRQFIKKVRISYG